MNRTALYELHQQANAKIVDFGGWGMPLHYGSQIAEHEAVRERSGLFDVSHMTIVDLAGPDVTSFLLKLLANSVTKLSEGQALYTAMLNTEGGILDDLIVYKKPADEGYRLIVNCATREKDLNWIGEQINQLQMNVQLSERQELSMLALQGPESEEKLFAAWEDCPQESVRNLKPFHFIDHEGFMIARTGYTGERGFEIVLPHERAVELWSALVDCGVQPAGLGARDTLRLEAGMHLYGTDMDESLSPLSCGLGWTVAWEPEDRDFVGRGALEAQKAQGLQERLVGVVFEGRGVLRGGMALRFENGAQGVISSGSFSPTLKKSVALARVDRQGEGLVEVKLRKDWVPVKLAKPCFVREGKSVIQFI